MANAPSVQITAVMNRRDILEVSFFQIAKTDDSDF